VKSAQLPIGVLEALAGKLPASVTSFPALRAFLKAELGVDLNPADHRMLKQLFRRFLTDDVIVPGATVQYDGCVDVGERADAPEIVPQPIGTLERFSTRMGWARVDFGGAGLVECPVGSLTLMSDEELNEEGECHG
jgi:hypothetical protein